MNVSLSRKPTKASKVPAGFQLHRNKQTLQITAYFDKKPYKRAVFVNFLPFEKDNLDKSKLIPWILTRFPAAIPADWSFCKENRRERQNWFVLTEGNENGVRTRNGNLAQ
jgi:hypothetical protein